MKQTEYFGKDSIYKLEYILNTLNAKDIFLVHGKSSFESSGAKFKIEPLLKNYKVTLFSDFSPNPKLEDINKGIQIYKKDDYNLIVAVGGGSVIDIAKSINILASQPNDALEYITNKRNIINQGKPLVAIPTTSGSGSEATHFAVVYVDGKKYSLAYEFILPSYAIIDPNLTINLSGYLTATTGMDALSQAIESYWAVGSTNESKSYSERAIKLILKNLIKTVNNPSLESRVTMSEAAHLAGKAINIAKTTAPHAISYFLTSKYGIAHGHATGLTLGRMFVYNSDKNIKVIDPRGENHLKKAMGELYKILNVKTSDEACNLINKMMQDINLQTNLKDLGIKKSDFNIIIDSVNLERLSNHPVKLNKNILKEILSSIY